MGLDVWTERQKRRMREAEEEEEEEERGVGYSGPVIEGMDGANDAP